MKVTATETREYDTDTALHPSSTIEYRNCTIRALVARIEALEAAQPKPQPTTRQVCVRRCPEPGEWVWMDCGNGYWFKWGSVNGEGCTRWIIAPNATEMPKYPPGCEPMEAT